MLVLFTAGCAQFAQFQETLRAQKLCTYQTCPRPTIVGGSSVQSTGTADSPAE
jgi:hypothetical protein